MEAHHLGYIKVGLLTRGPKGGELLVVMRNLLHRASLYYTKYL